MGAVYVVASVLLVPLSGYAPFFVASICGQIIASLVIDTLGLLHFMKRPLNVLKVVGAVLTLAGGVLSQDLQSKGNVGNLVLGVVLGFVAGWILPTQAGSVCVGLALR